MKGRDTILIRRVEPCCDQSGARPGGAIALSLNPDTFTDGGPSVLALLSVETWPPTPPSLLLRLLLPSSYQAAILVHSTVRDAKQPKAAMEREESQATRAPPPLPWLDQLTAGASPPQLILSGKPTGMALLSTKRPHIPENGTSNNAGPWSDAA
ncbi:hypothetical protein CSUB01_02422 [Colletotrichum sublineola]|uniref:Uncharacterized protein n=1 Tax=Colletotrichum sublineola TaxID=1173701 RepID=A0A066X0B0_COLSU|nr:hypothetical protein CSUB01_02422 [Colletotrichum sublineola]